MKQPRRVTLRLDTKIVEVVDEINQIDHNGLADRNQIIKKMLDEKCKEWKEGRGAPT